jgi:hypothetical protein
MTDANKRTLRPADGHTATVGGPDVATPAWINPAPGPVEAILSARGHDPAGRAATLWPLGQDSDTATRAGRYLPETSRHPQRTRAALAAHIINRYSRPGQLVFDGFAGSGTVLVEAVYAGRPAAGVEIDPRWFDLTVANLAFAGGSGATGQVLIGWRDTRDLAPTPRRLRHRVDLVVANPPLQFKPATPDKSDDATIMTLLERDMRAAISSWIPMLHPGSTLVFISRLQLADGYLLDPAVPLAAAARRCGLVPVERAAALRVPVRDALSASARRVTNRKARGPVVVHDDVLVYRVPTAAPRWRRGQ